MATPTSRGRLKAEVYRAGTRAALTGRGRTGRGGAGTGGTGRRGCVREAGGQRSTQQLGRRGLGASACQGKLACPRGILQTLACIVVPGPGASNPRPGQGLVEMGDKGGRAWHKERHNHHPLLPRPRTRDSHPRPRGEKVPTRKGT